MRNHLLYLLLRAGAWLLARVPVGLAYAVAAAAGSVAFRVARPARQGVEANLALAFPGLPAGVRSRIAREAFRHDAMNWVDTLRIPSLDPAVIPGLVEVHGWDLLEDAIAAGRGVVITMFHVGNFDLVGQVLAARSVPLSVPVERIQPERLHRFLVERREAQGITLVLAEHASRALLKAVRRGEVVGIAADRSVAGNGVEVSLFSRRCELPRGPAALARRTGAPLLVGVGIRAHGSLFRGYLIPVEMPRTEDAHADERAATQALATILECFVRAYPGQWLAFSPICE